VNKTRVINELARINEEKLAYIDGILIDFKDEIIKAQQTLYNSLVNYVKEFKTKAGVLDSTQVYGAFNVENLTNLNRFLEESGTTEAIQKLLKKEAKLISHIKETYKIMGIPLEFTNRDLGIVKAIKDLDLAKIYRITDTAIEEINRQIFGQVAGASKFSDMVENLRGFITGVEGKVGILEHRAKVWADTSVRAFDRKVLTMKFADDRKQKYVYMGGLVKDSRDFCIRNVGKIFTREEIDTMDNGQGLPVFEFCGGYNCQHSWVPVVDELGESDFADYRGNMKEQLEEVKR
jgi:hypothetical protein